MYLFFLPKRHYLGTPPPDIKHFPLFPLTPPTGVGDRWTIFVKMGGHKIHAGNAVRGVRSKRKQEMTMDSSVPEIR